MFLDASAAIAVLALEEDEVLISQKLFSSACLLFSPLAYYETCVGLARALSMHPDKAETLVQKLLELTAIPYGPRFDVLTLSK